MQSGRARAGTWVLEFEEADRRGVDPLTGWTSSNDTRTQIRLDFASKEEAVAYAEREGIDYHLLPEIERELKIQSYAENFR